MLFPLILLYCKKQVKKKNYNNLGIRAVIKYFALNLNVYKKYLRLIYN